MLKRTFAVLTALMVTMIVFTGCTNTSSQNLTSAKVATNSESDPVTVGKFAQSILENGEASHITVQHVLIGFEGSVPGKGITRSKEEAAALANEILTKAQGGSDFDQLVADHTDDSAPGIYHMANYGQPADMNAASPEQMVFERGGMVAAFGDVGFPLDVGKVGIANYDPEKSAYGWHVIKRLR